MCRLFLRDLSYVRSLSAIFESFIVVILDDLIEVRALLMTTWLLGFVWGDFWLCTMANPHFSHHLGEYLDKLKGIFNKQIQDESLVYFGIRCDDWRKLAEVEPFSPRRWKQCFKKLSMMRHGFRWSRIFKLRWSETIFFVMYPWVDDALVLVLVVC